MAAAGYGDELQHLDPVDDAPGGLQGIAAEIAGERAIVAEYFGGTPSRCTAAMYWPRHCARCSNRLRASTIWID